MSKFTTFLTSAIALSNLIAGSANPRIVPIVAVTDEASAANPATPVLASAPIFLDVLRLWSCNILKLLQTERMPLTAPVTPAVMTNPIARLFDMFYSPV